MEAERPKRTRDAVKTKARILAAAQQAFTELGYARAGIREIAAIAGVNSAMLIRYFGSKAKLFEAALIDAIPMFEGMDLSHKGFGARLTRQFMESSIDLRAQGMVVLSTGDPEARVISARVMQEKSVEALTAWLGPPNARARAVRMLMLSTGFMLYTRQVQIMSPELAQDSDTADWLARSLQAIIDESAAEPAFGDQIARD
jgi:AcrR family transcriptional regulator